MAKGWVNDDSVQDQISDSISDEICRARQSLPQGQSLEFCQECEEPIPLARQEALPGVTLCVNCQREMDNQNRGQSSLYNRRASKDSQLR